MNPSIRRSNNRRTPRLLPLEADDTNFSTEDETSLLIPVASASHILGKAQNHPVTPSGSKHRRPEPMAYNHTHNNSQPFSFDDEDNYSAQQPLHPHHATSSVTIDPNTLPIEYRFLLNGLPSEKQEPCREYSRISPISPPSTNFFVAALLNLALYPVILFAISAGLHRPSTPSTMILSTIVWLFAFVPLVFAAGGSLDKILMILTWDSHKLPFKLSTFQHFVRNTFFSSLLGAILLSIYIPLDSETILQRWPYAPTIGFMIGYAIGFLWSLIGGIIGFASQ